MPDLTLQDRVQVLRAATLIHGVAEDMVLTEPSDAELRVMQGYLLKRARQLVALLEGRIPRRAVREDVIDFGGKVRLRAIQTALGMPPPRSPPPAAQSAAGA